MKTKLIVIVVVVLLAILGYLAIDRHEKVEDQQHHADFKKSVLSH